jgi:hypothetical protein
MHARSYPGTATLLIIAAAALHAADPTPAQIEFFEKHIRPVMVQNCYACHSKTANPPMGGLRLDNANGISDARNRILAVLSYSGPIKMPPSGKLSAALIADFETWVKMGAPFPTDSAKSVGKYWALQPVQKAAVPVVKQASWVQSPIDAFVLHRLEAAGAQPGPPADKRTLIRRVTFDLIGLPPRPEEVDNFLKDESQNAFARLVDRLLASPSYGERWGRHWLDLVRYAETNGHEYDNDKQDPWRYRDYVIRAFNQDVPYNQFVREHIAGDLLPAKRRSLDGKTLESPLGTGFFWFGEVLNSPTDSIKARADQVDNQIDVLGKTFQGLTVACARCHDHKFDPIPTADYYALAGILHSTEIREDTVDAPEQIGKARALSEQICALSKPASIAGGRVHYRPEDVIFADFEKGDFGNWVTAGTAFVDRPIGGFATSLAAGSNRFEGTLSSPKFQTSKKLYVHVRLAGTKTDSKLRDRSPLRVTLVTNGYKGQNVVPDGDKPVWKTMTLTLERERISYFEIVDHSPDGYIAVDKIVFSDLKDPPPTDENPGKPPARTRDNRLDQLEGQIPETGFAMLATDYQPHNVRIHIRGDHQNLGQEVPRRFLQAVAGKDQPPIEQGSGRLYLANVLSSENNPLTARVMVNRIWKHHFGEGIVRTVDNFGAMGDRPTDPELLDFLAASFVESGWSLKAMHRMMLLSSAYQLADRPAQRLEAEVIRDSILAVAGTLEHNMYGPSVPPYISRYQDGRGKPDSGPVDGGRRRSIYIQVRRNFLTPLLLAYDYPLPISTIGNRSISTVPAQALLFMNNDFIAKEAGEWAKRTKGDIDLMYQEAFARHPEPSEIEAIQKFVKAHPERGDEVWADVAQTLFSSPEFVYVK